MAGRSWQAPDTGVMVKRLAIIGTLLIAPLVPAGAQLSCVTAPSIVGQWPAPLDRQVVIGDGVLSVRDAIERAGTAARVHFTYQADLLPQDRTVCAGAAKMRLGDALVQWLDGSRLKAVVAGEDRVVLAFVRAVSAPAPPPSGSAMATAQLAPVVVVEQGQPTTRENATISRTVVTGEQLEATGSPSMAQALSGAVPGLWMWSPSPTSIGGGMASLRGASSFGASYPKVYIDGIEVANPLFLSQLATDQIAQVEVIRGPQGSALYGAGAIGGVINITTRAAAGMADGRRVSLRSTAGIAESAYSPLGAFVQDHALSAQVGDAGRSLGLGLSTSTIGAFIPGAFSQLVHASAAAGFVGAKSRLQLTARFFSQQAGNTTSPLLPDRPPVLAVTSGPSMKGPSGGTGTASDQGGFVTSSTDSAAAQDVKQYTIGGTWAVASDRWTHTVVAGADGYRLDNVALMPGMLRTPGDSALLAASGGADRLSTRWSGVTEFGSRDRVSTRLTLGADHSALRDASIGTTVGQHDQDVAPIWRNTSGISAHADVSLLRSLTLNGGLRFERNSGFTILSGATALPSLGAAFRRQVGVAGITLRTAYGKAISPARVSMRPTAWGGRAPTILSLEPEEQAGIEFGADVTLGSRFTARLTRYDQRATNLVQPVASAPHSGGGGFSYQWQNVGAITNDGWEMESNVALGALSLSGALGLTDSRVERVAYGYTGDLRAGDHVLQVPRRTVSVSATWAGRGWSGSGTLARASQWTNYDWLTLSGDLSDPQMTPPHGAALRAYWRNYPGVTRLRASFSRDITTAFGLVVSAENLLNAQAGEPDNVTIVPGRTLRAGLRARF
ncbi:MAG: TonB-dependent receptor [Cytophagaceae bacterium]|nr:TonB-dependent receptor [Gemmatimonadaceae bacterium]